MKEAERKHEATFLGPARPGAASVFGAVAVLLAIALALVTVVGALLARRSHRPFPGLFTDAHGSFSVISWPSWRASDLPLRFPDRLVAIDGEPLPPPKGRFDLPAHRIAARLGALHDRGRNDVRLTFATGSGPVIVTRPILVLGVEEEVFFFGLYGLVGMFILWSGLAVLVLARRRTGAVAYAGWTAGTFIFMVTFYDYHSTARLAPVFSLATVWIQICLVWLAYSFPEPPRRRRRLFASAAVAITIVGAAMALALMAGPYLGFDLVALRVVAAYGALASLVVLSVSVLARLRTSSAAGRQELLSAAWGLAAGPALLAAGFLLLVLTGTGAIHILLPFLAPLVPLSIGYALIRHNILGTTAVLTRRMFVVPVLVFGLVGALIVWLALHRLPPIRAASAAVPWVAAALTLAALAVAGYRLSGRIFFPATAKFRPTLQQLADDLATKSDAAEIGRSLEEAVLRWLPTEGAMVVPPGEMHRIPHRPTGFRTHMAEGRSVWTSEPHWRRHLAVPMRSRGGLRGVLVLAPKHQAALYTREDLDLLETIASLGAVALHNADTVAELELLRRFEVDAARDDKRLTLGLLGAELSHEIAYPLNFLRYLLGQGAAGVPLAARDLEAGREEIGRLERMFAALHKLKMPVPRLEPVLVLPRVRRALDLIRQLLQESRITVSVDVPPNLTVTADPDALVQIFANLLRNAAQASPPGASIGARAVIAALDVTGSDGSVNLEVWDEGPGVSEDLAADIFNPFVSSKKGSMGLGLAVTQRLVRSLGWSIDVHRRGNATVFSIVIPAPPPVAAHDETSTQAEAQAAKAEAGA